MHSARPRPTLAGALGLCGLLLLACLAGAKDPAPSPTPEPPPVPTDLRWLADGSRLLVESRWLLDPAHGKWTRLPQLPASSDGTGGGLALVSQGGRRILVQRETSFACGPLDGPLGEAVPIPVWSQPAANAEETPERGDLVEVLFWLDERYVFVQQMDRLARVDVECRIWDAEARSWGAAPGCVEGDFYQVWRVDRGLHGEIAVSTAGEGHPGLSVARYSREKGQQPIPEAPELDLYPFGPAEAQFRADGTGVLFATPCVLERKEPRPCLDDPQGAWRLYSWTPGGAGLKLERSGLPEGVTPSPAGGRLAWPKPGQVCIGADGTDPVCFDLPEDR